MLVLWQLDSHKKQFRPRIGAPISKLACCHGDAHFAVSLQSNGRVPAFTCSVCVHRNIQAEVERLQCALCCLLYSLSLSLSLSLLSPSLPPHSDMFVVRIGHRGGACSWWFEKSLHAGSQTKWTADRTSVVSTYQFTLSEQHTWISPIL